MTFKFFNSTGSIGIVETLQEQSTGEYLERYRETLLISNFKIKIRHSFKIQQPNYMTEP